MAEDTLPKTKAQLLTDIEREWNALFSVVKRLSPEQMLKPDEGGWSPKDNLIHLAEWMKALMGYHMDRRPSHEVMDLPQTVTRDWDFEVINKALFERNKNRAITDVMAEVESVYATLIRKLKATTFEDLLKPRHENDPKKRPLLAWVLGDTTEHFAEHREVIERGLS